MSIIDSLVVLLKLDPKDFKKGAKDADETQQKMGKNADRRAKDMEAANKKAAESFDKIKREVTALTAAILGGYGLTQLTEKIVRGDVAVQRFGRNVNVTTQEMSAWEGVAKKFGSSTEDIDGAFRNLNAIMQDTWLHGAPPPAVSEAFARLGVDFGRMFDKSVPLADKMRDIQRVLRSVSRPEAQAWGQQLGFSESTVNMLVDTGDALNDLIEQQKKENAASDESARVAKELGLAWDNLTSKAYGLARVMLNDVAPSLERVLGWLNKLADFASQHLAGTELVVGAITTSLTVLAGLKFTGLIAGLFGVSGAAGAALGVLGKLGLLGLAGAAGVAGGAGINWLVEKLTGGTVGTGIYNLAHPDDENAPAAGGYRGSPRAALGRITRGLRNNNPGNLNFAGQAGASLEGPGGRFARFGSMDEGVAALARQLQAYGRRGLDSVKSIISTYAPGSENDTGGYVNFVSKRLGVGADQHLDLQNTAVMRQLIDAISSRENYAGALSGGQIDSGLALYSRGAGRYAAGNTSSSRTDVRVQTVNVNTAATDVQGISRDIGQGIEDYAFASQANWGLN